MRRNWKFWAALAAIAVGIVVFTSVPLAAVLPLLLVAACPLMMLLGGGMLYRGAQVANRNHEVIDSDGDRPDSGRERIST